jgi:hypothetical protein
MSTKKNLIDEMLSTPVPLIGPMVFNVPFTVTERTNVAN